MIDQTDPGPAPGRLAWGGSGTLSAACLACGDGSTRSVTVSVLNPVGQPPVLEFFRCDRCGSLQPRSFEMPPYYLDADATTASRIYVHVGAGIGSMIQPVAAALRLTPDARTLVDIGCGFGFAIDFAHRVFGLDACGIDPGTYAVEGAKALHVPIFHELLGHGSPIDGNTYDIVYSSEVLEHVADPIEFLTTLTRAVSADGILVLTTPAAEFVVESASRARALAALSPGYHRFIYSEKALHAALAAQGYASVSVTRVDERLVAFASRRRSLRGLRLEGEQQAYRRYLSILIGSDVDVHCRMGAAFRLYKEQVNSGEFDQAAHTRRTTRDLVATVYGLDIDSPASVSSVVQPSSDLSTFSDRAPFFLSELLYFRAIELLNTNGDPRTARDMLTLARQLADLEIDLPQAQLIGSAALYGLICLHEGFATLVLGDLDAAARVFEDLVSAGSRSNARREISSLVAGRSAFYLGLIDRQRGRHLEAMSRFSLAIRTMDPLPDAAGPLSEARREIVLASNELLEAHGCGQIRSPQTGIRRVVGLARGRWSGLRRKLTTR